MRGAVRVTRTWHSSKFVQEIVLNADSDQVEIVNDIDWHETHVLLKIAFALSASAPFATYEIPFGTIQRPTTRNNTWEQARFEVPAQSWADLGDGKHGFSLINEGDPAIGHRSAHLPGSLLRAGTPVRSELFQARATILGVGRFGKVLIQHPRDRSDFSVSFCRFFRGEFSCLSLTTVINTVHVSSYRRRYRV